MLVVYSQDKCPNCDKVIAYLTERNVEYKVIKIVDDVEDAESQISRKEFVDTFVGVRSVPYMLDEDGIAYRSLQEIRQAY